MLARDPGRERGDSPPRRVAETDMRDRKQPDYERNPVEPARRATGRGVHVGPGGAALSSPGAGFKAGHLLNGEFGGSGQDAANLTILTARANRVHTRFDNRVKDALKLLWNIYDLLRQKGIPVDDQTRFNYGIRVRVRTDGGTWDTTYPDNCIFNQLNCHAETTGGLALTADEQALLSDNDQRAIQDWQNRIDGYLAQANANGQTIDNGNAG